jgi:mono/diheme cytochrome c family protein
MRNSGVLLAVVALVGFGSQLSGAQQAGVSPSTMAKAKVTYADVQKILNEHCIGCHGADHPRAGINLTTYATVMKGGEEGAIVVPKDPAKSVLYKAIIGAPGVRQMPPRGPKIDAKLAKTVETWIKGGAKEK